MNAKDVLKHALTSTQNILNWYVSDLSDADLLVRPVPAANHIAWQIGHLISSESSMMQRELPQAAYPELPAGFREQHGKERAGTEPATGFGSKEQYLALYNKVRAATIQALQSLPDSDLEKAVTGPMAKSAPTLAALFQLQANHTMMHAGQFTVVRRKLGKPVLF